MLDVENELFLNYFKTKNLSAQTLTITSKVGFQPWYFLSTLVVTQ